MTCLQFELAARHLRFVVQRAVPVIYKGIALDSHYRVDLIVEDQVVVEVKSWADTLDSPPEAGVTGGISVPPRLRVNPFPPEPPAPGCRKVRDN